MNNGPGLTWLLVLSELNAYFLCSEINISDYWLVNMPRGSVLQHLILAFSFAHMLYCRPPWHRDPPANSTDETPPDGRIPPTQPSPVCSQGFCLNGGSCRPISLPSGASSFFCDCPLYFTGHRCEQGETSSSLHITAENDPYGITELSRIP